MHLGIFFTCIYNVLEFLYGKEYRIMSGKGQVFLEWPEYTKKRFH